MAPMSQQSRRTHESNPSAPIGAWLLASVAALVLSACTTSTSFDAGNAPPSSEAVTPETSSSLDSLSNGRFVGLYGEVQESEWSNGMPDGQASLLQVSFASEGADFDPEVDPSGQFIVYASTQHAQHADIYRKQVEGTTLVRLTANPAEDVMPAISPDGNWIAFASNRSGNWDIWMIPFEGGPATQVTFEGDNELHPSFSPDGSQLTYCRRNERTGRWEIWSYHFDSPGARTYVCDGLFPQWCPESSRKTILFQRARERGSQYFGIWTVDFEYDTCSNPTEIIAASDSAIMHPSWSPDGSLICFCTVDSLQVPGSWPERADVWMIGVDGTGKAPLTTGSFRNMQPTWSKDGRIYFVSDRSGNDTIWAIPAAASAQLSTGSSYVNAQTSSSSN